MEIIDTIRNTFVAFFIMLDSPLPPWVTFSDVLLAGLFIVFITAISRR
jgi:hypothetical protein